MMEKHEKIRAAVIGVGYLGRFHAQKYAAIDSVELVGIVDINHKRADAVAKEVGCDPYYDFTDLFGKVDAVSIAVQTPYHHEIAKAFLENNTDVLIEKPIALTVNEADDLIETAEKKNCIIQVGHLERFTPAVVAARGMISDPIFIECNRLAIYQPRGSDVSVVHDLMIHDIDLIQTFVHAPISYCHALGTPVVTDNADIANAHIEFENGAVANVTASRISNKSERKIRIFQKDGYIAIDFANRSITHIRPASGDDNCPIPGMHMEVHEFLEGDALEAEIRSFLSCVSSRNAPEVTGRMGREALKTAVSITAQIEAAVKKFRG